MEKLRPQAKMCFSPQVIQNPLVNIHKEAWSCLPEVFRLAYITRRSPDRQCWGWTDGIPHRRDPGLLLTPCSPGHASLPVLCSVICSPLCLASSLCQGQATCSSFQTTRSQPQKPRGTHRLDLRARVVVGQDGQEEPTQPRKMHGHGSSSSITAQ